MAYAPPPSTSFAPPPAEPAALTPTPYVPEPTAPSAPEPPQTPAQEPEALHLPGWAVPESEQPAKPPRWDPFPDRVAPPSPEAQPAPPAPPEAAAEAPAPGADPEPAPDASWAAPVPTPAWVWDPVPPSVAASRATAASGSSPQPLWLDPLPPAPSSPPAQTAAPENPWLTGDSAARPAAVPSPPAPAPIEYRQPVPPARPQVQPAGAPAKAIFREHTTSVVWPPRQLPAPGAAPEEEIEQRPRRSPRAVTPRPAPSEAPVVKGPPSLRRVRPLYVVAALSVVGALVAIGVNVHFNTAASGQTGTNPKATPAQAVVPQVVPSGIVGPTAIEFLTPVVAPGGSVTIKVGAEKGATCTLSLLGIHGESLNIPGAVPMSIDQTGTAQETVALDSGLAAGAYRMVVVCQPGSRSVGSLTIS
ncbi:MAG TPA: hypothetical protein VFW71_13785 [Actinomycetota bacterium]|nr:hypothetical protein [Actinomycetota bacterium]